MSLSQAESGSSKSYDLGTVDKLTQLLKCRFPAGLSSRNISLSDLLQQLRLEPVVKDATPTKCQQKNTTRNHRDLTNSPTEVTIVFEHLIGFNVRSATLRKPRDTTDTTNQISHFHTFPLLILEDFRKGGLPGRQQLKMRVEIKGGRGYEMIRAYPMIFVGHSESYVVCV